jgi:hypothetical protein
MLPVLPLGRLLTGRPAAITLRSVVLPLFSRPTSTTCVGAPYEHAHTSRRTLLDDAGAARRLGRFGRTRRTTTPLRIDHGAVCFDHGFPVFDQSETYLELLVVEHVEHFLFGGRVLDEGRATSRSDAARLRTEGWPSPHKSQICLPQRASWARWQSTQSTRGVDHNLVPLRVRAAPAKFAPSRSSYPASWDGPSRVAWGATVQPRFGR